MSRVHVFRKYCCLVLMLLAFCSPAQAQLYGLTESSYLYTLNPETGATTLVYQVSNLVGTPSVGLEFFEDNLYATDVYTPTGATFGRIDLKTGVYNPICDQGGATEWHSLAVDPKARRFYTVDLSNNGALKAITPEGDITTLGTLGVYINGLAFDSNHNILYGVDAVSLYTIDPTTAKVTLLGDLGVNNEFGLAYDTTTNTLYMNSGNVDGAFGEKNSLYSVNTTTGHATRIGSNTQNPFDPITGLAFRPPPTSVPAPPALAIGLCGVLQIGVGFLFRRRHVID